MDKECKAQGVTTKDVLDDKEIPYEVRMKYIIDAYRKDQVKWRKLAEYAKLLEAEVDRLKGRLKEQDEHEHEIKRLQGMVDSFPLRIYKANSFKSIITFQNKYIEELQGLLEEHNIPYVIRHPDNTLAREGIDNVVASAMEYKGKYDLEYPPAPAQ